MSQLRHHRIQLKVTIHERDLAMRTMDKPFEVHILPLILKMNVKEQVV